MLSMVAMHGLLEWPLRTWACSGRVVGLQWGTRLSLVAACTVVAVRYMGRWGEGGIPGGLGLVVEGVLVLLGLVAVCCGRDVHGMLLEDKHARHHYARGLQGGLLPGTGPGMVASWPSKPRACWGRVRGKWHYSYWDSSPYVWCHPWTSPTEESHVSIEAFHPARRKPRERRTSPGWQDRPHDRTPANIEARNPPTDGH